LDIQSLIESLFQSQLAAPALIASIAVPIAQQLPASVLGGFSWLKSKMFYTVSFHFSDAVFVDLSNWLSNHSEYLKFVQSEKVETMNKITQYDNVPTESDDKWFFRPAYGTFFMKAPKYPWMALMRTKEEQKVAALAVPADTLHIRSFIWDKKKLHALIKGISKERDKDRNPIIKLFEYNHYVERSDVSSFVNPDLLPDDLKAIEQQVELFLDSEDEYRRKNMRWNLGVMLHSMPGCGKSYFVTYLAKRFGLDIHYLSYKDLMTPIAALSQASRRSIVLMEDIDTWGIKKRDLKQAEVKSPPKSIFFEDQDDDDEDSDSSIAEEIKQNAEKTSNALLGDFLNALDGVISSDGLIVIATTNKISDIDDAILRPGRMDLVKEIKPLTPELVIKHWLNFFDQDMNLASSYIGTKSFPVSKSQEILKRNMNNKQAAMEELGIVNK